MTETEERRRRRKEAMQIISGTYEDEEKENSRRQEAIDIIEKINPSKTEKKEPETENITNIGNNKSESIKSIMDNVKNSISKTANTIGTSFKDEIKKTSSNLDTTKLTINTKKINKNQETNTTANTNKLKIDTNVKPAQGESKYGYRNVPTDTSAPLKDTQLKLNNNHSKMTEITSNDATAMREAGELNKKIKKGENVTGEVIGKNIIGGAGQALGGLINAGTTALAYGIKKGNDFLTPKAKGLTYILGKLGKIDNAEQVIKKMDEMQKSGDVILGNEAYNAIVDFGKETKSRVEHGSKVTQRIENKGVRTAGQVANVISEMAFNGLVGQGLGGRS